MKVLYVTNIPSPYRVEFFNELAKQCELFVTFDSLSSNDRNSDWFNIENIKFNYEVIEKGNIIKLYKKLNQKYDLIVIGGYSTINGMLSVEYLRIKKKKFIINADGGFIGNDNFITKFLKTHFISSASYYLSTSKGTNKYLTHYGAKKENIYIYPFTSLNKKDILEKPINAKTKKEMRSKTDYDCDKLFISVGGVIYRKGFDILISAFNDEKMKNNKLLIIGGGPLKKEYEKYINDNKIKNIFLLDFKQKEELLEIYKYSDIFILPTREDIWGLVINEALAMGLPTISTFQCLAATELIDKEYLYDCNDVIKLNKILKKINKKTYNELYEIGLENLKISKKYNIENMSKEHYKIFNKIINKEKNHN